MAKVPYNRPHLTGNELQYIAQAVANLHLSANGEFTARCQSWLEQRLGVARVFLTHSCTAALEMAALLAGVEVGDEVIMPSFTFVSTANAVVLRGGVPVFVDVRPDTLNLDESLIEAAITPRTRAICPVHYAGVAANLDVICAIAARHNLFVIEDAAQAVVGVVGALGGGQDVGEGLADVVEVGHPVPPYVFEEPRRAESLPQCRCGPGGQGRGPPGHQ